MKKILSVALIFVLVIGITACGHKTEKVKKEDNNKVFEGSFEVKLSEDASFENLKLFSEKDDVLLGEVNPKTDNKLTYSIDGPTKGRMVLTVNGEKVEVGDNELYDITKATVDITKTHIIVKYTQKDNKEVEHQNNISTQ